MALSAGPRGCRRLITRPALPGGRNTIEIQVRRALSVADTEAAAAWPAGPLVADDLTPKAAGAQSGKGTVASYAPSIPPIAADFCGLFVKSYKFICAMSNTATKIAKVIFGNTACLVAGREWVGTGILLYAADVRCRCPNWDAGPVGRDDGGYQTATDEEVHLKTQK